MANYSIKDLERLTGIKAHTIRIWEKRYNLIEPERTSTNIRAYCDAELKKLLNISILNKNGFKISKIAHLTSDEIAENINILSESSTDAACQQCYSGVLGSGPAPQGLWHTVGYHARKKDHQPQARPIPRMAHGCTPAQW